MNIVMGDMAASELSDKYTVLGLDWFSIKGSDEPIRAYCVVEHIPLTDMPQLAEWKDLHEKLMENYAKQNWDYCEQALEHLTGRWAGELDSFYQNLHTRILSFKENPDQFKPAIIKD